MGLPVSRVVLADLVDPAVLVVPAVLEVLVVPAVPAVRMALAVPPAPVSPATPRNPAVLRPQAGRIRILPRSWLFCWRWPRSSPPTSSWS